jgi:hypothetical protein
MRVGTLFFALLAWGLASLAGTAYASAQTADRITSLEISVWPEYDDPRVLVQYDGILTTTEGYPRAVSFYVPSSATLNAAAYVDESGKMLNTESPIVVPAADGLSLVTLKLPTPHFHLEYYDNALKGAPDKTLAFVYHAFLPADRVNVELQQPLQALNFQTVPTAAQVSEGMHGFKYHTFNYTRVSANQELAIRASYTKSDPNPSIQNVVLPETSAQTQPQATNAAVFPADPQPVYLVAGAAILAALALFVLWIRSNRRQPRLAPGRVSGGRGKIDTPDTEIGSFCTQCGNAFQSNENFCPRCGAKRK